MGMAVPPRHWQLEAIRGVAVVNMIFYHFMWDLSFFGVYRADVTAGGWWLYARIWATVFVLLVGVSIVFAGERRRAGARERAWYRRGGQLLGLALVITVVTRVFLGDAYILFGILHLVGVTMLLAPVLWRLGRWAPFVGAVVIWLAIPFKQAAVEGPWLLPLGMYPDGYPAVDYFPLVPWLGVVMTGMGIGFLLRPALSRGQVDDGDAPGRERRIVRRRTGAPSPGGFPPRPMLPFVFLGRHSLLIYLAHQPVMLAGFWLFGLTVW